MHWKTLLPFLQCSLFNCTLHLTPMFTTRPYQLYYTQHYTLLSLTFKQKSHFTLHSKLAVPLYLITSTILYMTVHGYTLKPFNTGITTLPYKLYYTLGYTVLGYTFKPFNVGITTPPYQLYYTLRI